MKDYEQMNLFCQAPAKNDDDDRIVMMEKGKAFLCNRDFPNDFQLFFEIDVIAYGTNDDGKEIIVNHMKRTHFMKWKEVQKYALKVTSNWSRTYDRIDVVAELKPLTVLQYFGKS